MEQLVILLVVGVIALAKWAIKKMVENGENPPSDNRKLSDPQSEEERMRKFMEALGVPAGSAPPRPVQRRPAQKAQKVPPLLVPPIRRIPQPVEQEKWIEPMPVPVPAPVVEEPVVLAAAVAPVETPGSKVTGKPAEFKMAALLEMLRSPQSARSAIVLREILGPPRGLQSHF